MRGFKQFIQEAKAKAPSLPPMKTIEGFEMPKLASAKEVHKNRVMNDEHSEALEMHSMGSGTLNKTLHTVTSKDFNPDKNGGRDGHHVQILHDEYKNKWLKSMDHVFDEKSNHVGQHHIVYTGSYIDPSKAKGEHLHVHYPAYISTSTSYHVAKTFGKIHDGHHTILRIHNTPQTPAISMDKHASGEGSINKEKEVLIDRGARLKITKHPVHIDKDEDGIPIHIHDAWHEGHQRHDLDAIMHKHSKYIAKEQ
jgi:hypothetical protein